MQPMQARELTQEAFIVSSEAKELFPCKFFHTAGGCQVALSQSDRGILTGCCMDFQHHLETACTAVRALNVPVVSPHKAKNMQ